MPSRPVAVAAWQRPSSLGRPCLWQLTMTFLAFLAAAIVLAITPGPGIAYVVARTAAGGRSEGLASCFGTGLGGLLHVVAAALGLSLLLAESA